MINVNDQVNSHRIVAVGANQLLRAIGTVSAGDQIPEDKLREAGQQMVDKYAELRSLAETREVVDKVSVWDLMDLDVLTDENMITEADMAMVQFSVYLRGLVQGIHKLGIEFTNDDFKDVSLITTKLTTLPKEVCLKIYNDFKALVNDPTIDTDLDDVLINATADLISERATIEVYLTSVCNIDIDELSDDELNSIKRSYFSGYLDWKREEAERVIGEVIKDPMKTVMILPEHFEDVKAVLMDVLPVEAAEWVSTLTPSSIYTGEAWQHMNDTYGGLDQPQRAIVSKAVNEFIEKNGVSVDVGNGQKVPILFSVNISEIILHTLIMASTELYENKPDADLSSDTEYILDVFRYVLFNDADLNYRISEDTAYRILACISTMMPIETARHSAIRSINREYNVATTTITTFITEDISKAKISEMSEEEKAKLQNKILGE